MRAGDRRLHNADRALRVDGTSGVGQGKPGVARMGIQPGTHAASGRGRDRRRPSFSLEVPPKGNVNRATHVVWVESHHRAPPSPVALQGCTIDVHPIDNAHHCGVDRGS